MVLKIWSQRPPGPPGHTVLQFGQEVDFVGARLRAGRGTVEGRCRGLVVPRREGAFRADGPGCVPPSAPRPPMAAASSPARVAVVRL